MTTRVSQTMSGQQYEDMLKNELKCMRADLLQMKETIRQQSVALESARQQNISLTHKLTTMIGMINALVPTAPIIVSRPTGGTIWVDVNDRRYQGINVPFEYGDDFEVIKKRALLQAVKKGYIDMPVEEVDNDLELYSFVGGATPMEGKITEKLTSQYTYFKLIADC